MSGTYTPAEGRGTIRLNKFKDNDKKPDFRGDAMFQGKMIEIALWRRTWPDGTEYFSAQVQAARERQAAAPQPTQPQPSRNRQEDRDPLDSDIPF